jgi:NAD(P)-dependent dehydrogenase (short-subunit alcohol dehydrogenase family)
MLGEDPNLLGVPIGELLEPLGWDGGKTILDDWVPRGTFIALCGARLPSIVWPGCSALRERPASDEFMAAEIAQTPLRRLGKPEDIADIMWFLVSDDARRITAQGIGAGGGMF